MNSWLLWPGRWSAGLLPPKDTTPCQAETELDTVLSWTDPVWGLAAELGQFPDSNSTPCEPTICPGRWRPEREVGVRRTPASVTPQRGASRKERPAGVRPAAAGAGGRPSEHQRASERHGKGEQGSPVVAWAQVCVLAGTQHRTPRPDSAPRAKRRTARHGGGASASRGSPAAVLTPARDFWMFSLALAMSRRITLAPFSCRQVQKEPVFSFIKKI